MGPEKRSRVQLYLEWTESMRWGELPEAVRVQVLVTLAEVLHQVAHANGRSEARHDG
jgi:hypothetical protein